MNALQVRVAEGQHRAASKMKKERRAAYLEACRTPKAATIRRHRARLTLSAWSTSLQNEQSNRIRGVRFSKELRRTRIRDQRKALANLVKPVIE